MKNVQVLYLQRWFLSFPGSSMMKPGTQYPERRELFLILLVIEQQTCCQILSGRKGRKAGKRGRNDFVASSKVVQ